MGYWGYYISPKAWLGKQPKKNGSSGSGLTPANFDIAQLSDIVYEETLESGLQVRGCCDGLFLFNFGGVDGFTPEPPPEEACSFEETALFRLKITEVMNAHIVCLRNSLSSRQKYGLRFQAITPHDMLHVDDNDPPQSTSFRSDRDADLYMARYSSTYNLNHSTTLDRRIRGRMLTVRRETIAASFASLDLLLSSNNKAPLRFCSLFNSALVSLQDHDYSQSLITSWAIIECLLDEEWSSYIQTHRRREIDGEETVFINSDRADKLKKGGYTISIKTEVLSLLDCLPFNTYKKLENVRRARNGWMHELKEVTLSEAEEAIEVTGELFESVFDFNCLEVFH